MPLTLSPTSQTTAMNLRHRIYEASPGAQCWDYSQGPRVLRAFTAEETGRAAVRLAQTLELWQAHDPQGFALWSAALKSDPDADPCAYCSACR